MLRNSAQDWGSIAKSFHWLVAMLILAQFVLGWIAEDMALSPAKLELFVWHKSIGLTILALVVLRLGWRLSNPPPQPLVDSPRLEDRLEVRLARLGHATLYTLMLAVPVAGWWVADTSRIPFRLYWQVPVPDLLAADKAASEFAAEVHEILGTVLLLVIAGHVIAALRHHFLLGNATLTRMLPFGNAGRSGND